MISGKTTLIAHLGYPTEAFKAPLIYNPYFDKHGIDAVVVPMGVKPEEYATFLRSLFRLSNIRGALVTMPHKVSTVALLDECSTAVQVAGSCNAILLRPDGTLLGDMFDGAGFSRGLKRKNFKFDGASCLIVGSGGVGSAIAASIAAEHVAAMTLFDNNVKSAQGLGTRLKQHYPKMEVRTGLKDGDPLPVDVSRLSSNMFVGEVVMKQEVTPFLRAAQEKGCRTQVGTDMLYEQIPAYLEFFGFPTTTAEELRAVSKIAY